MITIKRIFFFIALCGACTGLMAKNKQPNFNPNNIMPQKFLDIINDMDLSYKTTSDTNQAKITRLENELENLTNQYSPGSEDYKIRKEIKLKQIEQLHEESKYEREAAKNAGNFVTGVFDVGLKTYLEIEKNKALHQTRIEEAAVNAAVTQEIKNDAIIKTAEKQIEAFFKFLDKDNLLKVTLIIILAVAGIVTTYYGAKFIFRWLNKIIAAQPKLASQEKYKSLVRRIAETILPAFLLGKQPPIKFEESIVFPPKLEAEMKELAEMVRKITSHNKAAKKDQDMMLYPRLLLYGPSGTGKTHLANNLAEWSGMDFMKTSADRFCQYSEQDAIRLIHEQFEVTRPTMIFIDEIDTFASNRNGMTDSKKIAIFNALLVELSNLSPLTMVVAASNRELDIALKTRFNMKKLVPLPGMDERIKLIQLYLKKYIKNMSPDINDAVINQAAAQTEGISGRELESMIHEEMFNKTFTRTSNNTLTLDIFNEVLNQTIKDRQEITNYTKPL
ncbi:MAG: AAA family ATPase [Endomicrobiales bacterium]|nr:AAA family ATPase [Endomicrobiales bacterium]